MPRRLSVVMPVYNGERFIEKTIASVFKQDVDKVDIEIIAVNDASTDASLSILQRLAKADSRIKVVDLSQNGGVTIARNEGIRHANGQWLSFIDHDDLWDAQKLSRQFDYLSAHPTLDCVLSHQQYHLEGTDKWPAWVKPEWREKPLKGYVFGAMLIKKSDFLKVGYLDESYRHGVDDVDWFSKVKEFGLNYDIMDDVLLHRRIHGENISSHTLKHNPELLRICREKIKRANAHAH